MIRIGSLFSGIGGFELGLESALPKAETIWQVEKDPFCQSILKKNWPTAELFSDIRLVSHTNLKPVDIVCGGFPCQDISLAGKGEGLNGEKSSLWFEMLRIVSELRPRIIIVENVAAVTFRGLDRILGTLSEIGYDAEWRIISASQFGAFHKRRRFFLVAYKTPDSDRFRTQVPSSRQYASEQMFGSKSKEGRAMFNYWNKEASPEPVLCRMVNGVPDRVARLKALGNAIVPQCSRYVGEKILQSGLLDDLL